MTKEESILNLDNMLLNPKAKNFVNHLVRSYMPITNISKVIEKPKGVYKCVITGEELNETNSGVTGKDTTTFMSEEGNKIFTEWVTSKAFKGDKHMNWLLKSIKHSSLIPIAEKIKDQIVQNKVEKLNSAKKTLTYTLGDSSDVLAKLKASLESKEK